MPVRRHSSLEELMSHPVTKSFGQAVQRSWVEAELDGHSSGRAPVAEYSPAKLFVRASIWGGEDGVAAVAVGGLRVSSPTVHRGEVQVSGPLVIDAPCLITGDLRCDGGIDVCERGLLAVGGRVEARSIQGSGWFIAASDAAARFVTGSYEQGMFIVAGALDCDLAVFSRHAWSVGDNRVRHVFDFWGDEDDGARALELAALVSPQACTGREHSITVVGEVDLLRLAELANTSGCLR